MLNDRDAPAFRELAEERGGLPSFATREFDEYLAAEFSNTASYIYAERAFAL